MSRTSSRREGHQEVRFHRAFRWLAIIALAATVASLSVYALQGPRLRSAVVDVVRAIDAPAVSLRLESDRPVGPLSADQIAVTPQTPVSVSVSGALVTVVFDTALRYDTDYEVVISDVQGATRPSRSTWRHTFKTPAGSMTYLERGGAGEPDRILEVGVAGQPPRELYRENGIDLFVPIGSTFVKVGPGAFGGSQMTLVQPVTEDIQRLVTPKETRIDTVFTPAVGTTVLFTASSIDEGGPFDRTLFRVDTAGPPRAEPVVGLDGKPLRVTKAFTIPGTDSVVAWVDDVRVVQIDLRSGLVLPVAEEAQELWGVSGGGRQAVLVDIGGSVAIDIENLEEERLQPGTLGTRDVFEGQLHLLADGRRVQTVVVGNERGTDFTSLVVLDDGQGLSQALYRTPGDVGSIGRFVVSPNDQYVAIETTPDRAAVAEDGREIEPRPQSVTTVIIDIDSGELVRSVEGFWPVW